MTSLAGVSSTRISEATVRAHISGAVSGQVAVGEHINQVGSVHGDLILQQRQRPTVDARPRPVNRPPSRFPNLLGREHEVATAVAKMERGDAAGFHGASGTGKSSVLRHLAHVPDVPVMPDGVLHCPGRGQPLADLLQLVFDGFYDADMGFTPTPGQIRHHLSSLAALVVVDDLELSEQDMGDLFDTLPKSTLLLSAADRCVWGSGRSTPLRGLPEAAALALLERELERSLAPEEEEPARALWDAVRGHPRRLVQIAAEIADEGLSLAEVASEMVGVPVDETIARRAVARLDDRERDILALVAAVEPAPLHADRVRAITGDARSGETLERLRSRHLVEAHSPRYSSTITLPRDETERRHRWAERALDHYLVALDADRATPQRFAEDVDAIRALVTWAAGENRPQDVIRLVRSADPVLAVARRWEARSQLVRHALTAARSIGDSATVAWCYHQLGTRALWLGDHETAWYRLSRALELRRSLGDRAGAEVTQFHLDQLGPPPPLPGEQGPPPVDPPPGPRPRRRPRIRVPVAVCLLLLLGAAFLLAGGREEEEPIAVVRVGGTAVEVKPATLSFDDERVGTSSPPKAVTLTVKGPDAMSARGATVGGEDFAVVSDGCQGRFEVGDSCRVAVRFTPSAAGDRRGSLVVDTGSGEVKVALAGGGAVEPGVVAPLEIPSSTIPGDTTLVQPTPSAGPLVADRADVSFGDVRVGSTSPLARVVLRNTGSTPLQLTTIAARGPVAGEFKLSESCQGAPLAPLGACDVEVSFTPSVVGARTATLTVAVGGAPSLTVLLKGTGIGPQLQLTPETLAFPQTQVELTSGPLVFTVTNTGTAATKVDSVSLMDAPAFSRTADACQGTTLRPNASCTISVSFAPVAPGPATGRLFVTADRVPPLIGNLAGTGVALRTTTTSTTTTTTITSVVGLPKVGQNPPPSVESLGVAPASNSVRP